MSPWSHTFCHSLVAAFVISFLAAGPFFLWHRDAAENRIAPVLVFFSALAASLLHLLFDLCQAQGIMLLWPFTSRRFVLDWIAHLDSGFLGILFVALLLPKLASLVGERSAPNPRAARKTWRILRPERHPRVYRG